MKKLIHLITFFFLAGMAAQDIYYSGEDSLLYFTFFRKNWEEPETFVKKELDSYEADDDLYSFWDTLHAHPYDFHKLFTSDSIVLHLVSDSNEFCIPFRGNITSPYGWRKRRPHYGVDIDLEKGDTIRNVFAGIVRLAKYYKGYGNCVIVRHNNGLETVYAHLSRMDVKPNQEIPAGSVIGLGGNTGRSHGAHLHWEIRFLSQAINPEDLVDFSTFTLKKNSITLFKKDFEEKYDWRAFRQRHKKEGQLHGYVLENQKTSARFYKIRKGDTLSKIAKNYGTTVKDICRKNKIHPGSILKPGRILKI